MIGRIKPRAKAPAPLTCSVEEAARLLGIGRGAAYQAAREGRLPVVKFGCRYHVSLKGLEAMLAAATARALEVEARGR